MSRAPVSLAVAASAAGCCRVHGPGQLLLLFGPIHGGVGGCVDDGVGLQLLQSLCQACGVGQVDVRSPEYDRVRHFGGQVVAYLSAAADDDGFQSVPLQ